MTARAVETHEGFHRLARSGFVARAVVYILVGILSVKLAVGSRGTQASQQGALETVARQPFGKELLVLVAIGLASYALWRLYHALAGRGPERADSGLDRVVALASGLVYAGLCAIAVEILLGSGGSGSARRAAAGVLGWPGGTMLVGAAGVVLAGVGLLQGYRAFVKDFLEDSKTDEMSPAVRAWFEWIGSFGYLARMVVFVLVGAFLVEAAVTYDPSKAVGLDGALAKVVHAPAGSFLLALVAAGLIAFGIYSLADARYRRL